MSSEFESLVPYFINFVIVLAMLAMIIKKPLRRYIYQRHERIRDVVEGAQIAHSRAKEKHEAAQKVLANVDEDAAAIFQSEASAVEAEKSEIISKARAEALRLAREAERLSGAEADDALARVKREFLELVVREAEGRLKSGLKRDDHSAILKRAKNSIEVGV